MLQPLNIVLVIVIEMPNHVSLISNSKISTYNPLIINKYFLRISDILHTHTHTAL